MTPNSQFATRHARAIMKPFCCDFFHLLILGPELRESRVALYVAARARFTQFLPQKSTPLSCTEFPIPCVEIFRLSFRELRERKFRDPNTTQKIIINTWWNKTWQNLTNDGMGNSVLSSSAPPFARPEEWLSPRSLPPFPPLSLDHSRKVAANERILCIKFMEWKIGSRLFPSLPPLALAGEPDIPVTLARAWHVQI